MRLGRRAALGLAAAAAGVRGLHAQAPGWAACSNRAAIPSDLVQASPGSWPTTRVHHLVAAPVTGLQLVYVNWYVPAGLRETALPGPLRVRAAIELPSGEVMPCRFEDGSAEATIPPGGLVATAPLRAAIQAGATLCSRTAVAPANGAWPTNLGVSGGRELRDGFLLAASPGALLGTIPDASLTVPGYGPSAVLGQGAPGACAIVGDSIAAGAGDRQGSAHKDHGFLERALAGRIGTVNLARGGDMARAFASGAAYRLALLRRAGCDRAAVCYGTNDIGSGAPAAGVEAALGAVWTALAQAGAHRIAQCTVLPRTTPLASAAVHPLRGYEPGGSVQGEVNAWLRGHPAALAAVLDAQALVDDHGLWRTQDGTPLTDDGTHPNTAGAAFLAQGLSPGLAALTRPG